MAELYKLSFYVPESHLQQVKEALFNAGAGRFKHYDKTCWQTHGQGQFRPLSGANPALGEKDQINYVTEYKVEMICKAESIHQAVTALKATHPYEEPAYDVVRLEPL